MTELETFLSLIEKKGKYIVIKPGEIKETYIHFKDAYGETTISFIFDRNERLKTII